VVDWVMLAMYVSYARQSEVRLAPTGSNIADHKPLLLKMRAKYLHVARSISTLRWYGGCCRNVQMCQMIGAARSLNSGSDEEADGLGGGANQSGGVSVYKRDTTSCGRMVYVGSKAQSNCNQMMRLMRWPCLMSSTKWYLVPVCTNAWHATAS
jgi:hypothetical protein